MATPARMDGPTRPRRVRVNERDRQALSLRGAGLTFVQIAKQLGYKDASHANRMVTSLLRQVNDETVTENRALIAGRLDVMLQQVWPNVLRGNIEAIETALKIEAQRMRLYGLGFAPVHVNVNTEVNVGNANAIAPGLDSWADLMASARDWQRQQAIETETVPEALTAPETLAETDHETP